MIPNKSRNFAQNKRKHDNRYGKIKESICIETAEGESH